MNNRKFCVSSDKNPNGIDYTFSSSGYLVGLDIKTTLSQAATETIIKELPANIERFLEWVKGLKNVTVVEVHQCISFDMFWKKYNDPTRSSKKRTLVKWNKMPETEQVQAYHYIDTYERNRGYAEKKYAETYLNAEMWNN